MPVSIDLARMVGGNGEMHHLSRKIPGQKEVGSVAVASRANREGPWHTRQFPRQDVYHVDV